MATLNGKQLEELTAAISGRVGSRSNGGELATAYMEGVLFYAFHRTTDPGPVPTSLVSERAALLIEVSRALGRMVEDYEIQALMRLTASQAKSLRRTLIATYTDDSFTLLLSWSLRGAKRGKRARHDFAGTEVSFAEKDRRDGFVELLERDGVAAQIIHGDEQRPWLVVVGDSFPSDLLPSKK